jgi:hypothetical protein
MKKKTPSVAGPLWEFVRGITYNIGRQPYGWGLIDNMRQSLQSKWIVGKNKMALANELSSFHLCKWTSAFPVVYSSDA